MKSIIKTGLLLAVILCSTACPSSTGPSGSGPVDNDPGWYNISGYLMEFLTANQPDGGNQVQKTDYDNSGKQRQGQAITQNYFFNYKFEEDGTAGNPVGNWGTTGWSGKTDFTADSPGGTAAPAPKSAFLPKPTVGNIELIQRVPVEFGQWYYLSVWWYSPSGAPATLLYMDLVPAATGGGTAYTRFINSGMGGSNIIPAGTWKQIKIIFEVPRSYSLDPDKPTPAIWGAAVDPHLTLRMQQYYSNASVNSAYFTKVELFKLIPSSVKEYTGNYTAHPGGITDPKLTDRSVLTPVITEARTLFESTSASSDGKDVPHGSAYVLWTVYNTFEAAINNAEAAVTQVQIDDAADTLSEAIKVFKAAMQTAVVTKTALNAAITAANELLGDVVISADGNGLTLLTKYTSQADYGAFETVINAAEIVAGNATASQNQTDTSLSALNAAQIVFSGTIKLAGTANANKTALGTAITNAEIFIETVKTQETSGNLPAGSKIAPQADIDVYLEAIDTARNVFTDLQASQGEADGAVTDLGAATTLLNSKIQTTSIVGQNGSLYNISGIYTDLRTVFSTDSGVENMMSRVNWYNDDNKYQAQISSENYLYNPDFDSDGKSGSPFTGNWVAAGTWTEWAGKTDFTADSPAGAPSSKSLKLVTPGTGNANVSQRVPVEYGETYYLSFYWYATTNAAATLVYIDYYQNQNANPGAVAATNWTAFLNSGNFTNDRINTWIKAEFIIPIPPKDDWPVSTQIPHLGIRFLQNNTNARDAYFTKTEIKKVFSGSVKKYNNEYQLPLPGSVTDPKS